MLILRVFKAAVLLLLLAMNTIVCALPLYVFALLKLVPNERFSLFCSRQTNRVATAWARFNRLGVRLAIKTRWKITGMTETALDKWYLVIANHQSWLDIVVLQTAFSDRIPFLKFFLKDQLKWVPLLGLAWWGLDFPFMRRYSKEQIAKNPKLKGRDLQKTQQSCQNFLKMPAAVMNFVEGTRFTQEKHDRQQSPYKNLLIPRAGGIGTVMATMGKQLDKILDVTIVYPKTGVSLWTFLKGEVATIRVHISSIDITPNLIGDYFSDLEFQKQFKAWLNQYWHEKDQLIDTLKAQQC